MDTLPYRRLERAGSSRHQQLVRVGELVAPEPIERIFQLNLQRADDLDWEQATIRVRRSKRHGVQMYPLTKEVGGALLRYKERVLLLRHAPITVGIRNN